MILSTGGVDGFPGHSHLRVNEYVVLKKNALPSLNSTRMSPAKSEFKNGGPPNTLRCHFICSILHSSVSLLGIYTHRLV